MMIAAAVLVLAVCQKEAVIELSQPLKGGGGLGTTAYEPTAKEAPFLKKVTEKPVGFWSNVKMPKPDNMTEEQWQKFLKDEEKANAKAKANTIPEDKYALADQAGQVVGWFGILRETAVDDKTGVATLTIEHKYFDGMIDLHQQIVSIYGGGDFTATMKKPKTALPALALVRVYGKVAKGKDGPTIAADYVRVWDWGIFAFMDYGKDKSNEKWTALRKVKGPDAYTSRPTTAYYESLLGPRE